jgi:hypothetical protein
MSSRSAAALGATDAYLELKKASFFKPGLDTARPSKGEGMKDYYKTSIHELLNMPPSKTASELKALRIELLKRAMEGEAVDNSRYTKLMAKVSEVDVFLSGISSRRMFWIAMGSLAVTAIVSGLTLYLRLR